MRGIILHMLIAFLSTVLWYNKPKVPKNHTGISFITWFCRKSNQLWDFKIWNSIWITKGLDNRDSDNKDSDNRGSTVYVDTGI